MQDVYEESMLLGVKESKARLGREKSLIIFLNYKITGSEEVFEYKELL